MCSVNHQALDFILSLPQLGQAVTIMVGGAQGSLHAIPGEHRLVLRNRKGFVHLALRHGASLVPVYSFGENDVFTYKVFAQDSWQHLCQMTFKKFTVIFPCIFWGRSLFSANFCSFLPYPLPITTVGESSFPGKKAAISCVGRGLASPVSPLPAVGRPIPVPQGLHPTNEGVDHYHKLYTKALQQLSEEHKESCGVPASTHSLSCSPGPAPAPALPLRS